MMKKRKPSKRPARRKAWSVPSCKRFTGYKPCFPDCQCYKQCVEMDTIGKQILIINLDAMGNVLATTSILPSLKRKYPRSTVNWITLKSAAPLLQNISYLDRIWTWEPESWMILREMTFDMVMNIDKSQRSGAFAMSLKAKQRLGFGINRDGVIVPVNREAEENYILGLDDHLKFRVNQKTVSQLQCEEMKLKYVRDEYTVSLSKEELAFCEEHKRQSGILPTDLVVGLNTGCSELYPNKKMTIEQHVRLIEMLRAIPGTRIVLVGGPEDTMRNAEISRQAGSAIINTATTEGVRRGLCYVNLCDIVISGDSFGMHMAIGLKKHVIVWFGVSCSTEIDLFGRGVKLVTEGLACSPCWKKQCPYSLECIQMIDLAGIASEVRRFRSVRG